MNKMVKLGLVVGGAVSVYFVFHKGSNIAVSNKKLRDLAENEVPDIYSDRCVDALAKYEDARVAADGVRKADKVIRDQAKIEVGYSTAVSNEKSAKEAFDAAKKALKDFKPDSTQVAVGSGESAVAINVQNSGQKVLLETNLREAQSKYDMMKSRRELLDDTINQKVITSRTPEQLDIMAAESKAYREYQNTLKEYNKQVDQIMNNDDWKYRQLNDIYKSNVTKTDVITDAIGLSAFPVAILVYIWSDAITKIKLLNK